jgi:hypothetical protein
VNVLFVSPYRQNDSWGLVSRNYIKALLSNPNINLTTRPLYYTNRSSEVSDDIVECENSTYGKYDIVLQKLLPHSLHISKTANKNIALLNVETGGWNNSRALLIINKLDEIYVATAQEKKWLEQSGVNVPIKNISQPIDVDFLVSNQTKKIGLPSALKHTFNFYCIVDNEERSNLSTIIRAFHLAFNETDRVGLVIKIDNSAPNTRETRKKIQEHINSIKKELGVSNVYKNELIINDYLDETNMIGLHNACDCFISVRSGNNFCNEVLSAMFLGKTPIVMQGTGLSGIVDDSGFVIKSEKTPVIMHTRSLPVDYDLFNSDEFWHKPMIYSLIDNMRSAFALSKNKPEYSAKQSIGRNNIQKYSYSAIGSQLCN